MKLKKELNLNATKQQLADLHYVLDIVRINQNTHGEPDADKQSVRAYKLLDQLFTELGI